MGKLKKYEYSIEDNARLYSNDEKGIKLAEFRRDFYYSGLGCRDNTISDALNFMNKENISVIQINQLEHNGKIKIFVWYKEIN
jgi:hypothetical protein